MIDTFDQVVRQYERTSPLVSKHHSAAQDVRPIGDRRRKWERIKKVDDNTYALCDGNYGNTIWSTAYPEMGKYENAMAPIVWTREADGDYITVRNHNVSSCSVTRYKFLRRHLPRNVRFHYNQQGQHWLHVMTNGSGAAALHWEEYPLPKTQSNYDYSNQRIGQLDDVYIKFRANEDGTFTRVSRELKVKTKRVDKEAKKKYAEPLAEFFQFTVTMAPLLGGQYSSRTEYTTQFAEYVRQMDLTYTAGTWRVLRHCPAWIARLIVSDSEHEMRPALAALVANDIGFFYSQNKDIKVVRAAYNRLMNHLLGMYVIEEK